MTSVRGATEHVTQWGLFELELEGPSAGNPFQEVELGATFTQGARAVDVQGFYDGDGVYRVRFMPDATGSWSYETKSNAKELDGLAGYFDVGPARAGDHGPVRVADTFHFAYADGTSFKPIGTTAYAWNHQGEAMEQRTLASLEASPFNKIRMCVFPKHYRYNENEPEFYPFPVVRKGSSQWTMGFFGQPSSWAFDFERFDPAFFRHLEKRIADLGRIGIEADLIVFHPYDRWGFATMTPAQDDFYLRYLVARLAALPNVWWSLANEYDLMPSKSLADWDRFLRIIAESDPYGHLRSNHNCFAFFDHTHPLITHCSIQRPDPSMSAEWREKYGKPVVVDECCYEGDLAEAWGNISGREMVHRFWDGSVNGGYVTHGETYRHPNDVIWWAKGGTLEGDSIPRLHFLRRILERVSGNGLEPVRDTGPFSIMLAGGKDKASLQDLMAKRQDKDFVRTHFAGAHEPHKAYLTYFGVSQPAEVPIAVPAGESYEAHLIDTWEMTETPLDKQVKRGDVITIPAKPYQALLLTRVSSPT
jgi:hypothetical protein